MADPITDAELEELKAGLVGVTPGPWRASKVKGYRIDYVFSEHPSRAPTPEYPHRHFVAEMDCGNASEDVEHIARCSPDKIAALIARLEAAEGGWQDIATAPKDGQFVLLHVPEGLESGTVTVGAYWKETDRNERGQFRAGNWDGWLGMDRDIASSWCEPTHWMPLPATPSPAKAGG